MLTDEEFCSMGKSCLLTYLQDNPDEIISLHERYNLCNILTQGDLWELAGNCPEFQENIENIIVDFDFQEYSKEYWEEIDDGYDPDDYYD